MRAGNSQTSEFFHKLAIGSSVVSAITTIIIAVAVPLIFLRANFERELVAQRSQQFKEDSNRVWATLHADQRDPSISHESSQVNPSIQYFTRKARSPWSKHVCSGIY
ncbi:Nematode cuticle collagen N-terminal domain containing protein [Ditylenchus destructor]|nr:Nematode cuticle collagen N-terminal domain containing protein [Ditylenchus destructor]